MIETSTTAHAPASAPDPAKDGDLGAHAFNILLVDDQPENLVTLSATLEGLEQNLVMAHSGREALRYLLSNECALIILDVVMPGMDGFETARLIRERQSSKSTPIIFLTAGDSNDAQMFRGYSVGAVDYIQKPVVPEVLRSKASVFVELARKAELVKRQGERLRLIAQRDHEREIAQTTARHEAESYRIKSELLAKEIEAARTRASLEMAEARARHATDLEQKNAELERAKDRAERESRFKSKFLARMSHELRTPLNAIIGFSELLEQEVAGPLASTQKDYVTAVLQSGRHLLGLVDDVLDLSKVEADRLDLARQWTPLSDLVESVERVVRPLAQKQGVSLVCALAQDLPPLYVDPLRIKEVLYNLLSNGIKFTRAGGRVALRAAVDDRFVEVTVSDTGIGIGEEDMPRLFREFEQLEAATTSLGSRPEGTGLGLVICRRLVDLHGGTIAVASVLGEGTVVTVRLPASGGSGGSNRSPETPAPPPPPPPPPPDEPVDA